MKKGLLFGTVSLFSTLLNMIFIPQLLISMMNRQFDGFCFLGAVFSVLVIVGSIIVLHQNMTKIPVISAVKKTIVILGLMLGAVLLVSVFSGLIAEGVYAFLHHSLSFLAIKQIVDGITYLFTILVNPLLVCIFWNSIRTRDINFNQSLPNWKTYILLGGMTLVFFVFGLLIHDIPYKTVTITSLTIIGVIGLYASEEITKDQSIKGGLS